MTDEGWEERMAQRARQRAAAREAAEEAQPTASDPHGTHHHHFRGGAILCSCGELMGVVCTVIDPDHNPDDDSCDLCGAQGVIRLNGANQ